MEWGEIKYGILFVLLPLMFWIYKRYKSWYEEVKQKLADVHLLDTILVNSTNKNVLVKALVPMVVLFFLVLSLMDPLFGNEEERVIKKGIDTVFVLDVSKSMDAKDVAPSRLERAKRIISLTVDELAGGRISLVIFAGSSHVISPLTSDYSAMEIYLTPIETHMVSLQGTEIASALTLARELLIEDNQTNKLIVLLSDGENHQEGLFEELKKLKEAHISVVSLAIGTKKGAPIPLFVGYSDLYKENAKGQIIISKLEGQTLKKIAEETRGKYIPNQSTQLTVRDLIDKIKSIKGKKTEELQQQNKRHNYQLPLFLGIIAMIMYFLAIELNLFKRKKNV